MTEEKSEIRMLTRREAILRVSSMLGGVALVGQTAMLASCSSADQETVAPVITAGDGLFSDADIALLDEIADTILPETDTPGAKAAEVGAFMALMVTDCYYPADQEIFRKGLATIDERARESFGSGFASGSADDRLALVQALDAEQYEYAENKAWDDPAHFFRMMKELTVVGYFTSEIGYTAAMRYVEAPGRWDPCLPLEEGEKFWANHASSVRA